MKILVYDDNPAFGGHQIMAVRGANALQQAGHEIVFAVHPKNLKLCEALSGLNQIPTAALKKELRRQKFDQLLAIQGDISQSIEGLRAAQKAGIESVSYLAIPHRLSTMGAKFGALRDLKNKPLFNGPNRFITISERMKSIMKARGCKKPICVVPNGIPIPTLQPSDARKQIKTLGLIGRIEFKQKQKDFLIQTFLRHEAFSNHQLLIVGDGPDEAKLKALIHGHPNITHLPWQENMDEVYQQLDLLIIPSRYEGVPLVMLEALAYGIPVMGSNVDGMKDVLPSSWTFTPEDKNALAHTFRTVRKTWMENIDTVQQKVLDEHTLEAFNSNFVNAVTSK